MSTNWFIGIMFKKQCFFYSLIVLLSYKNGIILENGNKNELMQMLWSSYLFDLSEFRERERDREIEHYF